MINNILIRTKLKISLRGFRNNKNLFLSILLCLITIQNRAENSRNKLASFDGKPKEKTIRSNCPTISSFPYYEDFNNYNTYNGCWKIIDGNEIQNLDITNNSVISVKGKWCIVNEEVSYRYHNYLPADDWLISPKIKITQDLMMTFSYRKSFDPTSKEYLSVWVIKDNPENYSNPSYTKSLVETFEVINHNDMINLTPKSLNEYIDEEVYIGIKCSSPKDQGLVFVDNFYIYKSSGENNILKFSLPTQTEPATINFQEKYINIEVSNTSDLSMLTPSMIISPNSKIFPEIGSTQDFTHPFTYTVTAENGTPQDWIINVTNASTANTESDILSFSFPNMLGEAEIIASNATVNASIRWDKTLLYIIPTIEISKFANISPQSGHPKNFLEPIQYIVTSESGIAKEWTITINIAEKPDGMNCDKPLNINLSEHTSPHKIIGESTVAFENTYTNTDLGNFDKGSDKIYKLSVDQASIYSIGISSENKFIGIALFDGCPSTNNLILKSTSEKNDPQILPNIIFNTYSDYYLMVDSYDPFTIEIDSYDLEFIKDESPTCKSPSNIEISNISQTSASLNWLAMLNETKWQIKYGSLGFSHLENSELKEVTETSTTISELNSDTSYDVYIRSVCPDINSDGDWQGPFNFKTLSSCPIPSELSVNSISENSALVSWNGHNANNWIIEYKLNTSNEYTSLTTNENPYTIQGLSASQAYELRIKAKCGDLESSRSETISFSTICTAITDLPYKEDFENYGYGSQAFPNCWTRKTTTAYDLIRPTIVKPAYNSSITSNSLSFLSKTSETIIAASPSLNFEIEELVLSFKLQRENLESGNFIIGLMDNPNDFNSFTLARTIVPDNNELNEYEIKFKDINNISGSGKSIAFSTSPNMDYYFYWLDDVNIRKIFDKNDILTFKINQFTSQFDINYETKTITGTIPNNIDKTKLSATITVSEKASIDYQNGTILDFSNEIVFIVSAENGQPASWTVNLSQASTPSSEKNILSFTFPGQIGTADIDANEHIVTASLNWESDITNIIPTIETSNFASITPESGSPQDFTNTVEYTVTSESQNPQIWEVSINQEETPLGGNCNNPVILELSTLANPHIITDETTQGFGNIYSNTDLGDYDNGLDKIYKLNLTEGAIYSIKMQPKSNYAAIALFRGCPSENILLKNATNLSSIDELVLEDILLQANTDYFLMADSHATNSEFIESYDLSFIKIDNPSCTSPNDLEITEILQTSAKITWTTALNEIGWELKYGSQDFNPQDDGTLISNDVTSPYDLLGLTKNTNYSIYIRSKCSSTEYGQWHGSKDFTTLESCPKPNQLNISDITSKSATLSWQGYTANNWMLEYKISTAIEYQSIELSESIYSFTDLEPGTSYKLRIKSKCEEQESAYSDIFEFNTHCGLISNFPYLEEFHQESISLDCWTIIDVNQDGNTSNGKGKWSFEENTAIYKFSSSNAANDWLISPRLKISEGQILKFSYKTPYSNNQDFEKFSVYALTESPENFALANKILPTVTTNTGGTFHSTQEISLEDYISQEIYIGIKCESEANQYNLSIDEFEIYFYTAPVTYELSASVIAGEGSITPTHKIINKNDSQEFIISPGNNEKVDKLFDNDIDETNKIVDNTYKLLNISEDHNISLSFKTTSKISESNILNISIYPNPTNDVLNIEVSDEIKTIEIINVDGKIIDRQSINKSKYQYHTNKIAEGNYFIKIFTKDKIGIKQFSVKK